VHPLLPKNVTTPSPDSQPTHVLPNHVTITSPCSLPTHDHPPPDRCGLYIPSPGWHHAGEVGRSSCAQSGCAPGQAHLLHPTSSSALTAAHQHGHHGRPERVQPGRGKGGAQVANRRLSTIRPLCRAVNGQPLVSSMGNAVGNNKCAHIDHIVCLWQFACPSFNLRDMQTATSTRADLFQRASNNTGGHLTSSVHLPSTFATNAGAVPVHGAGLLLLLLKLTASITNPQAHALTQSWDGDAPHPLPAHTPKLPTLRSLKIVILLLSLLMVVSLRSAMPLTLLL
jgi:hypothetical protein